VHRLQRRTGEYGGRRAERVDFLYAVHALERQCDFAMLRRRAPRQTRHAALNDDRLAVGCASSHDEAEFRGGSWSDDCCRRACVLAAEVDAVAMAHAMPDDNAAFVELAL
jgi:hypothetical protein